MSLIRYESQVRPPLVDNDKTYHQVTEDIVRPIEAAPNPPLVDRFPDLGCVVAVLGFTPSTAR